MLTKQTALKKAKAFIEECRKLPITIDKAILFGSFAEGKGGEYSDIDIAMFSKKFSNNILANLDLIGKVNIRYPEIEAHTYPSADYGKKGIMLDQINKTGIEL